ncbi:hypothetical protein [Arthrobacter sp. 9AX]|uniref:hypothetical protein n=1 Tax=Arthrobacter sp. 9AX TaxID=2653131 RepID=UPI00135B8FF7|nr:hypothetical protein [Arthrobacter sp. 9AX]
MSAEAPDPDAAKRYAALAAAVAWTSALDTLEAAVEAAEAFLDNPVAHMSSGPVAPAAVTRMDWLPPALEGHIPASAVARARILADKQASIARRLAEARQDVQRQLQAVSSVPGIGESRPAVYLDVTG